MSFLADLMDSVLSRGRSLIGQGEPPRQETAADLIARCRDLLSSKGEAVGVALAESILARYRHLSAEERGLFLSALVHEFAADPATVDAAIAAYQAGPDEEMLARLHHAAEPPRQEVLRRLNLAPNGTLQLVRMREDVLRRLTQTPALSALDRDFHHLFASWFNRGFLVLRPIDWTTPANILEKIIRYEAVHAIESWQDLRRRLEPGDRRCFAFFHPQMVDEPLVFVEVALTGTIPDTIASLLAEDRQPLEARAATTAVFYSISNCQDGLRGVSFGNFLIKQVVTELARDLPNLATFVTLSPVPGFAQWLRQERQAGDQGLLEADLRGDLDALDQPDPPPEAAEALSRAAAVYFLKARRNGRPIDPVARFHLGNGARLERLNPGGDPSPKGRQQSLGLMVNYLYAPEDIEKNHEAFINDGQVIAAPAVTRHLVPRKGTRRPRP